MSRSAVLTDAQWARIEPLMPCSDGNRGRPFRDHRQVIEGIVYRLRTGIAWRDLPASFGPWQTVWKRHKRFSVDGTWDKVHARLVAEADAAGEVEPGEVWSEAPALSAKSLTMKPGAHRGGGPVTCAKARERDHEHLSR